MPKEILNRYSKEEEQALAVKVAIAGSAALFVIAAAAGIIADSITLLLDAATNLVILVTAVFTHTSVRKVHRPPDHIYNFGYTKYEPLTIVMQGALIIMTCLISAKFAIQDMIHPEDVAGYGIPVIAEIVSGVMAIAITWYINRIAHRTDSAILKGSVMQWKVETILSFGIAAGFLAGFVLREQGYAKITPYVDPVMAIMLALLLVRSPIKAVAHNILELLDAVPAEHIQGAVRRVVEKYKPRSFGVSRLRSRKAGKKIFVDVCFMVKSDLTVGEVGELADNFEKDLKEHLPESDTVVYFKPKHEH
jgi:cation diffusion facilitator family transporter